MVIEIDDGTQISLSVIPIFQFSNIYTSFLIGFLNDKLPVQYILIYTLKNKASNPQKANKLASIFRPYF